MYDSSNESTDENNVTNDMDDTSDSSTNLSTMEENAPKLVSSSVQCNWVLGQLAWARVGNFPFWPCVITLDPVSMIYNRLKGTLFIYVKTVNNSNNNNNNYCLKRINIKLKL